MSNQRHYTNFKAILKRDNRAFLDVLKTRYGARSAAAALNQLLHRQRQTPEIMRVECPRCPAQLVAVNVNSYVACSSCNIVFTTDRKTIWAAPPVGVEKK